MNVIDSIYNEPEKWTQTDHTFRHQNGAQIWTSNIPILDTNMYPEVYMSLSVKFKIWRAIKWWSRNAPIEALGRT